MSEQTYPPVLTKADFSRRYRKGEFGNASPSWENIEDFITGTTPGPQVYHLRNAVAAGGQTYYNQTRKEVIARWCEFVPGDGWYVSEMVPPEVESRLLIQGEVQQTYPGSGRYGLDLYFTYVKKPMRIALQEGGQHAHGLRASGLIKQHLCPNSQEWLEMLLERYLEHVIEFSTYSRKWGTLWPSYNTVFWEVRAY
jgi:hypothetical protein